MNAERSLRVHSQRKWFRSESDRWIFGVCGGIAQRLNLDSTVVRALWVLALLFYGVGLGLYLVLAICLPAQSQLHEAESSRILGVCAHLAKRWDVDVAWVRTIAVFAGIASLGLAVLVYGVAYFVIDSPNAS